MTIPTTLYIHIPWCIRKCPYCDFNSHKIKDIIPETDYIKALINDFKADLNYFPARRIDAIFIGGGTPNLLMAKSYELLLQQLQQLVPFAKNLEITIEANPGAIENKHLTDYPKVGINRLSLGIQSFNSTHLKSLGRIHDDLSAHQAIEFARQVGFANINLDLMYGLPGQSAAEGLDDLKKALSFQVEHLSWYQLTIEPNTVFYKKPPVLPHDNEIGLLEEQGLAILAMNGYKRYEISAFCRDNKYAQHNLNYWLFGDYYGIGAGAHGKITTAPKKVYRVIKFKHPKNYLNRDQTFLVKRTIVKEEDLLFEFMLNTTRLQQRIPQKLFTERVGLPFARLRPKLLQAQQQGLLSINQEFWQITALGRRFTNDLQAMFLPGSDSTHGL